MTYRNLDSCLAYATSNNAYLSKFDGNAVSDISNACAVNGRSEIGSICKVILLDDTVNSSNSSAFLVMMSSGKILDPFSGNELDNSVWHTISLSSDVVVNSIFDYASSNRVDSYFATSHGVCRLVDGKLQKIDPSSSSEVLSMTEKDGLLWYGDNDGNIMTYDFST